MIYAWQRSPWNHIRLSCMCQTGNNKGRKAPSWLVHIQASLNLGRILLAIAGSLAGISRIRRTSACQQQLMSMATCTHASRAGWAPWRKRQPTESEWQSTPSQRPSTGSAHPNRKHHRGDKEHQPATTPNTPATASMLAMRAAQSETIPPANDLQPCGFLFLLVILFPDHSFPCDASIPMVCGGGEPDTKLMETAKHTASESKTNHSGKLHGIASWPVPKFRSQRIQPWMVRNGSRTSCFIILSHMHGKYFRLTQHTPSFPDSTQAVSLYAEYIHICIHALTHHSWLYSGDASIPDKCLPETSRQQWNEELPRGRHGTVTIRSDTWRQSKHRFHMLTAIIQRRIEQDEHDPVQFCSSTYVDIADNNRKSQANPLPAFHMLSLVAWRTRDFRSLIWHLTGMTGSSQHDHKSAITWQSGNEELANTLVPGQYQQ